MFELLLAATLACSDGQWIIAGIRQADLPTRQEADLVLTVLESMPEDCSADQYDPDESTR